MTEGNTPIQPTPEEHRINQVRSIIFGIGEDALVRLHNNRDVANTHILAQAYMHDMVDHCLGQTMPEHTKRVKQGEIAEVLADELGISLWDARLKVNLFAVAIDKATKLAMNGAVPEQTIACGSLVTHRPLRQMGEHHQSLTDAQAAVLLATLVPLNALPESVLGEFDNASPMLYRAIFGHLLTKDMVEKFELDEVTGETAAQVSLKQMDILRRNHPEENDEIIGTRHMLYKVQFAAEALVQAIEAEGDGAKKGNIRQLSQRQAKPAREQLVRVLTDISAWEKERATMAVRQFESQIRSLSSNVDNLAPASQSRQ